MEAGISGVQSRDLCQQTVMELELERDGTRSLMVTNIQGCLETNYFLVPIVSQLREQPVTGGIRLLSLKVSWLTLLPQQNQSHSCG